MEGFTNYYKEEYFKLLRVIQVPKYRRTYTKSESIRAKYYEKGKHKLPKKYCNMLLYNTQGILEPDGISYSWRAFPVIRKKVKRMVDLLVNAATGERVIANENVVGTQNIANINGQDLYNGRLHPHQRAVLMGQIKDQLTMYLASITPIPTEVYPIIIDVIIYDVLVDKIYIKGLRWDIENRFFPYSKAIGDALKDCGIITDDSTKYITGSPRALFVPVNDVENRKMVITIYQDLRPEILNSIEYGRATTK